MESFFACSTNPHVLTTATSASEASSTRRQPAVSSRPASSSESTSLRAHPSVTRATVRTGFLAGAATRLSVTAHGVVPPEGLRVLVQEGPHRAGRGQPGTADGQVVQPDPRERRGEGPGHVLEVDEADELRLLGIAGHLGEREDDD